MSKMTIVSSGSKGNCIVIESNGEKLIVDLGVDENSILKSLNYKINDCVAALCSHSHQDHSKSLDKFIKLGIPCYGNDDVCDKHVGCNKLPRLLKVGGFKIQTFELAHNVPNNAFIIDTSDGIRILYCTDTREIPFKVKNVNYAIIECNYDFEDLVDNMASRETHDSQFDNHHNIDDCIDYLKTIYSEKLRGVILWHLSRGNINWQNALKKVKQKLFFDDVYLPFDDKVISLQKDVFL